MAIKNRHAAKRALDSAERQVLITRKGTTRTAYVRESITNKGMEMADRFLATGRP
jgi:predicted DNA-binding protein